jgi:protein-L-isoaspartate O-methyltransferase
MMSPVPERVRWAVQVLDIGPSDEILEIGPGLGVATSLICGRLVDGHITAIDRSATAVRRTTERNAECIASGKAAVLHADLSQISFESPRFDKVFAINVNLFWVQPDGLHWQIAMDLLRPGGRFSLFYEAPLAAKTDQIVRTVATAFACHGFATSIRSAPGPALRCVEGWLDADRPRHR